MSYSEEYLKGWSDAYIQWVRTNKVPNNPPEPVRAQEVAPAKKATPRKKTGGA